jgi:alcohol dehydrogenase class IV
VSAAFTFLHSNRELTSGPGAAARLTALAKGRDARRAALVLDPAFLGGPIGAQLAGLLEAAGAAVTLIAGPRSEPALADVEACAAALAAAAPDMVVVAGGGSAMDCAKVARMLVANPGPIGALVGPMGVPMRPHTSLFVALPTTAGTGSEVSESAVIHNPDATYKAIFRSPEMTPGIALLDAELAAGAPPGVTAASGYDAVTHAVEAYTSKAANPVTDALAEKAMTLLAEGLEASFRNGADLPARQACLLGSAMAAMAFNSAHLGLAHAISGAAGALHHVPHGLGNALALPFTMAFNAPVLGAKGATIARLFGGASAAEALSRLRLAVGLDQSLDTVVPPAALDALAEAASKSGQVRVNPRTPSVAEIRAILEAMRTPTGGSAPKGVPA